MTHRFPSELLRALRNDIAMAPLIRCHLHLPTKERDGWLRFLCPLCGEFHTAVNPKTNLARCFRCRVNFNPIEMVMAVSPCRFVEAVKILTPLLAAQPPASPSATMTHPAHGRR
jgi:DNA primase